jgi:hypothetical protein
LRRPVERWVAAREETVLTMTTIANGSVVAFDYTLRDGDLLSLDFACAVDGRSFRPCTSPFRKKFRPGKHSFQVKATDSVGTVSAPISYRWKVLKKKRG